MLLVVRFNIISIGVIVVFMFVVFWFTFCLVSSPGLRGNWSTHCSSPRQATVLALDFLDGICNNIVLLMLMKNMSQIMLK